MRAPGRRTRRTTSAAVVALFVLGTAAATTHAPGAGPPLASARTPVAAGFATRWPGALRTPADVVGVVEQPPPAATPAPPVSPVGEVVIAPPPERFEAPPSPPPPPPPQLAQPFRLDPSAPAGTGTGTWAVVIGINDYPGQGNDLRSAVNDADDVDLVLAGLSVPAEQRLVLRDGQATAGRIREAVEWLVARSGPDATAVFFYGGHVRKLGITSEALVGADGGVIEDRELGERLARLPARRAWIAIAACFGGGFTELLAPGRVLTGAAAADALAYESSQFGRSFLVQYMVREGMLERRAPQSVQAAFSYAVTELAREHPDRLPVQIDLAVGPLDLRQPLPPPPTPAPGAPPTPPPTTAPCRQLLILACRS